MKTKSIAILILAVTILIGAVVFMANSIDRKSEVPMSTDQTATETKNKTVLPKSDVPEDNVTVEQMTKEQANFFQDFAKKTK
ncbi:MAG: hypothetical protein WAV64_04540 [Candidatus Moraniibacteriota bacterium]